MNVQLIRAADDSHLWAATFDRKVTDVFSAESAIAKTIADQLGAKLTGNERQAISSKPTDVPEAYDAYLRGLTYELRANAPTNVLPGQNYLRRAVQLDPKFALAWARLAQIDAGGYMSGTLERTPALREEANHAAEIPPSRSSRTSVMRSTPKVTIITAASRITTLQPVILNRRGRSRPIWARFLKD